MVYCNGNNLRVSILWHALFAKNPVYPSRKQSVPIKPPYDKKFQALSVDLIKTSSKVNYELFWRDCRIQQ